MSEGREGGLGGVVEYPWIKLKAPSLVCEQPPKRLMRAAMIPQLARHRAGACTPSACIS